MMIVMSALWLVGCTASTSNPDTTDPAGVGSATAGVNEPSPSTQTAASPADEQQLRRQRFDWLASCYTDAGFPATSDGTGVEITVVQGQDEAFHAAAAACREQADVELGPNPGAIPPTAEELEGLYELQLRTRDCLLAEGYDVVEPPSREVWIEETLNVYQALNSTNPGEVRLPWSPHDDLDPTALTLCPPPDVADLGQR